MIHVRMDRIHVQMNKIRVSNIFVPHKKISQIEISARYLNFYNKSIYAFIIGVPRNIVR